MKSLRILVVEDSPVIGMLLAQMLKSMGHDVCAVETNEQAAAAAATRHSPDLMIVDAVLGRGSGVNAVEAVLSTRFIPHIYMSGAPVQTGRLGSVVLLKPFVEADLSVAIRRAVGASATA